jgi:hypothetical protein
MPEFGAVINAGGKAIFNIANSSSNSSAVRLDALNLAIQSVMSSGGLLSWATYVARDPVTTGGTLPQIDGMQVVAGDRVLRVGETDKTQNGLFAAVENGVWTRIPTNPLSPLVQGSIISILSGIQNTGTGWMLTTPNPVIGTSSLTFVQFNGGQRSGQFSTQIGNGSSLSFDLTHNLNTLNLQGILVRNTGSPYSIVTGYTPLLLSANSIRLTFASAPTTNQYTVIITGQRDEIWSYDVIRDLQLSQASAIVQSQSQIVSLQSADTAFNIALALKAPLTSPSFTGFTTLGDNVAIKCKQLTGTTASTQGGTTSVAHGIGVATKILAVSLTINYATNNILTSNYTAATGYQVQIGNIDNTNIAVVNVSANSANILSKPFNLLVTYIA